MQLNINQTQQNPTFGYFNFTERALKHFLKTLKTNQLDRFEKIVENEAKNKTVQATVDYNNATLTGYLRTLDSNQNPISAFCKDLGEQGIISKMIDGPLGYLEKISKASSKMLEKYNIAKKVEDVVGNANKQ